MYGGHSIRIASTCANPVPCFTAYTGYSNHPDDIPLILNAAIERRNQLQKAFKHRREHFAFGIGLTPKTRGQRFAGVPEVFLPKLKSAYPPPGHDIYESAAAHAMWDEYRKATPFPDRRRGKTWKPFHELDPDHLQYTVGEKESAIIRDSKSKEIVCIVLRNFSKNQGGILDWVNGVIKRNTDVRKSVRVSFSLTFSDLRPDGYFSLRILGNCARLATPLGHGTILN